MLNMENSDPSKGNDILKAHRFRTNCKLLAALTH